MFTDIAGGLIRISEKELPSWAEVSVRIWKGRCKLPEVAVEWWGETFKGDTEVFVQRLKDAERKGSLRAVPFVRLRPHVRHVALQ